MGVHPRVLVNRYHVEFTGQLPLIRDGVAEAIHQGRVATRRMREGLRLLDQDDCGPVSQALAAARGVGQTLGRVRELDVLADLLRIFELRIPMAAAAAVTAVASLRSEQRHARRQMIKRLDVIDLNALALEHRGARPWGFGRDTWWQKRLAVRIHTLGTRLLAALQHASGIYLPNRSHRLRVIVKKLRYAVEAAGATGVWTSSAALPVLRGAQSRLGRLHDLHIAHRRTDSRRIDSNVREQMAILRDVIAADIDRHQQRFLKLRADLVGAADDCLRLPAFVRRQAMTRRGRMLLMAATVPGIAAVVSAAVTHRTTDLGDTAAPSAPPPHVVP